MTFYKKRCKTITIYKNLVIFTRYNCALCPRIRTRGDSPEIANNLITK